MIILFGIIESSLMESVPFKNTPLENSPELTTIWVAKCSVALSTFGSDST